MLVSWLRAGRTWKNFMSSEDIKNTDYKVKTEGFHLFITSGEPADTFSTAIKVHKRHRDRKGNVLG